MSNVSKKRTSMGLVIFVKVWARKEGGGGRRDPNATIFLGGLTHEHIFFVQKLA